MSFKDITDGRKTAKPVAARFMKSPKTGTVGMEIKFEFLESTGAYESLNWVGWLTDKAMESTMDTLVNVLGFNGNDECDAEGILVDKGALNWDQEVSIVVELENYNGKQYPKIKWVNKLNQSPFGTCAKDEVKGALDKLGFKAKFLAVKQQSGGEAIPAPAIPESEIPF